MEKEQALKEIYANLKRLDRQKDEQKEQVKEQELALKETICNVFSWRNKKGDYDTAKVKSDALNLAIGYVFEDKPNKLEEKLDLFDKITKELNKEEDIYQEAVTLNRLKEGQKMINEEIKDYKDGIRETEEVDKEEIKAIEELIKLEKKDLKDMSDEKKTRLKALIEEIKEILLKQ